MSSLNVPLGSLMLTIGHLASNFQASVHSHEARAPRSWPATATAAVCLPTFCENLQHGNPCRPILEGL